jgi:hypothetical protein
MEQERGSDVLKRLAGSRQHAFDATAIQRLGEIVDRSPSKVLDWTIYGQPAIDRIRGTLRCDPKDVGTVVTGLVSDQLRWNVRLFPYGIPFPDEVIIHIEHGPGPVAGG